MKQIYTEIRIAHKTEWDKTKFENELDLSLIIKGYTNRAEFIREKIRELKNGTNDGN